MHFHPSHAFSASLARLVLARRPHVRLTFSLPRLVRLLLVALLLGGFALGAWSGVARAATRVLPSPSSTTPSSPRGHVTMPSSTIHSSLPSSLIQPHAATATNPYDTGLGVLPFYTYIHHPLNTCACGKKELLVNVANGNLVLHSVELQIHGTGEDLSLDAYYNSQPNSNAYQEMGSNWNMSLGRQVYLDESNVASDIILHGTSNYDTYFAHNADGSFRSPPGNNATLVDNHNGTYTLTYHSSGQKWLFGSNTSLSSITDKNGNAITLSESGNLTSSITDTQGRVVTVGHTTSNLISGVTDATGRSTTYGYNTSNLLTSSTDLLGKPTGYTYTGTDITTVIDARNNSTTIAYDSSHRVTSITDPMGFPTTFTYNAGLTIVTDPSGHSTGYYYDSGFKVTTVNDALGHNTSTAFDATNYNVTSTTDALSNTNTFGFDAKNNLTTATDGNGNSSSATYNNPSFSYYPDTATDAQGNKLSYAYDAVGNVASTKDALAVQNNEVYAYNSNGTLATATDANGHATSYGYDSKGNLTSITPPSPLGKETLTRDTLSRVTNVVDGNGNSTSFEYNALDRIVKITYANGSTTSYTYDDDGNQLTLTDNTGTTSFIYDSLNRLNTKKLPNGTTLTYTYNKVGNLLTYTDPGGTVGYTYNKVNLLSTINEANGSVITYGYDNANRRTSMTLPTSTGITMSYGYDNAGHTTSIKAVKGTTSLLSLTYSHTKALKTGTTYSDNTSLTYNFTYSYDVLNRLTGAAGSGTTSSSYAYDGAGNRTSATSHGVTTTYSYNSADELVSSLVNGTTTAYSYDGNGNQLTGAGRTFSINNKNQTTAITSGSATDSYTYSGADQTDRVQRNGSTALYSALGLSVDGAGSASPTYYTRTNAGQLVNERTTSGTYYYLMDDLGSVLKVVDSSGTVKNSYYYDPFGNSLSKSETVSNPWQYASGYLDASTGLYKFGTRYYDPQLGRWTQKDPVGGSVGKIGSGNPYVYADNVPTMLTDPSGRDTNPIGVFEECFHSAIATFIEDAGYIIGAFATFAAGVAIIGAVLDGATLAAAVASVPAWIPIVAAVGAFLIVEVAAFCIGEAIATGLKNL